MCCPRGGGAPEVSLPGADAVAVLQQVRCERMSHGMAAHVLGDFGPARRELDATDPAVLVNVMAANLPAARVGRQLVRRKDELPVPLPAGVRIFDVERMRQLDIAVAMG